MGMVAGCDSPPLYHVWLFVCIDESYEVRDLV